MARLVTAMGALFTSFDQCMFGAESVKPTVLLASPAAHDAVRSRFGNVKCTHGDGAHNVLTGETNGVYNTAAAAAYTPELNATLAATFMAVAPAPATRATFATVTPDDPRVGTLPAHDPIEEWRLAIGLDEAELAYVLDGATECSECDREDDPLDLLFAQASTTPTAYHTPVGPCGCFETEDK